MPTFNVKLCKRTRIYKTVEVEAGTAEQAEEIAQEDAHLYDFVEGRICDHAEYEVCGEPEEIV